MVVDNWVATIGSANMDMRSFKLNFEINAFIFGPRLAGNFAVDLQAATEATQEWEQRMGLARQLVRGIARLLSPLL